MRWLKTWAWKLKVSSNPGPTCGCRVLGVRQLILQQLFLRCTVESVTVFATLGSWPNPTETVKDSLSLA